MKIKLAMVAMVAGALINVYPTAGKVVDIQYDPCTELSEVTVQTGAGLLYSYVEDADDLYYGDIMALIMWNRGTPNTVLDDVIIDARYSGFWEVQE